MSEPTNRSDTSTARSPPVRPSSLPHGTTRDKPHFVATATQFTTRASATIPYSDHYRMHRTSGPLYNVPSASDHVFSQRPAHSTPSTQKCPPGLFCLTLEQEPPYCTPSRVPIIRLFAVVDPVLLKHYHAPLVTHARSIPKKATTKRHI